ncbi:hypothetical protein [Streptomyces sp. NPDC020965]|uniref:hypothetical protein n=1 Tax=Streptomyces sp. NPDC020965 TaxID=3365105 RepID=UPI00378C980F
MATPTTPLTAPSVLARRVAELLPCRAGIAWTAAPYAAWWTTRPAFRLTQAGRPGALILAAHLWRTEIAWQLDDREPYEPDLTVERRAPEPVVRETLRLVLPRLDDAAAVAYAGRPAAAKGVRLRHLNVIGSEMRAHGAATLNRVGDQPNSHTLSWGHDGVRYVVTLTGANPGCDVTVAGPVAAVERVLPLFLPEPAARTPRLPLDDIGTSLGRRVAAHLAQFTDVDQLDDGALAFGDKTGPFGYVAAPCGLSARVRETTPVAAEVHGVGVDHLVHLAPLLTR